MRRLLSLLALVGISAVFGAGCGGIQGSHSISPASLFLPGLLKNDPPAVTNSVPARASQPVKQVALAR